MADQSKDVLEILGPVGGEGEKPSAAEPLHLISEELMDAVHKKDAAGVADALRAAFAECGSSGNAETSED